jgi:hypothetical protein
LNATDSIIHPGHFPMRCKNSPNATDTTWYMRVNATMGQTARSSAFSAIFPILQRINIRFHKVVHVSVEEVANVTNTKQGSSNLLLSGRRAYHKQVRDCNK